VVVVAAMGLVCWYTMSLIVRRGAGKPDFILVCRAHLGEPGRWAAWLGSVMILVGAIFAYDILLATNVYSLVAGILERVHGGVGGGDFSSLSSSVDPLPWEPYWTPTTAPIIFGVVFLPLLNVPRLRFYVRMASFGVIGMLYVVSYIVISALIHWQPPQVKRDYFFKPHAFFLAGIMALAFFIHNFVLQVTQNPDGTLSATGLRDASIGFSFGGISYATIGALTYGERRQPIDYLSRTPLTSPFAAALGNGVPQDYFDFFANTDIFSMTGKVAVIGQLGTVLPFIFALLRTQLFTAFFGQKVADRPHWALTLVYSVLMLTAATLLTIFYPHVGDVLRFTGAFCGVLYVFALPILVHCTLLYRERRLTVFSVVFHVFVLLIGVAVLVSQFIS
jgi:sodium-coupled neutral amino acid transporter 9